MENQKKKIPKHILKKKQKRTINLNQRYKKEQKSTKRERERERVLIVLWGKKHGLNEENDIKFIQNEMERKIVKI